MKKKGRLTTVILILIFVAGLSLLLYPTVSDLWNSMRQTRAIAAYNEKVASISHEEYEAWLSSAIEYNANILHRRNRFVISDQELEEYGKQLDIDGSGIMGYIEIPKIDVDLPIYHGTSEKVLQVAVGHMDWTSLPIGGESTHCVLSGHRGLPSARLFTDLDKLEIGDTFEIYVLDDKLTYEVDQILVVLPEEMDELGIIDGGDYCTLVTCTPYGINTHRLLVRGHRIENSVQAPVVHVTADAVEIEPLLVSFAVYVPLLILIMVIVFVSGTKRKKPHKKEEINEK